MSRDQLIDRAIYWALKADRLMMVDSEELAREGLAHPTACIQLGLLYAELAGLPVVPHMQFGWQPTRPADT